VEEKDSLASILDLDGNEIAIADVNMDDAPGVLEVQRVVDGRDRLFHYYFRAGMRHVVVDCGDVRLPGTLRTRWHGTTRLWHVHLRLATVETPQRGIQAKAS
jgi:hypothetical protein